MENLAMPHWFKIIGRLALAALCGAIFALVPSGVLLYALFAAGGYTRESLIELPSSVLWMIGGIGACIAIPVFIFAGHTVMPKWLRTSALGSVIGMAVVLLVTLILTDGGSRSKSRYLEIGLLYGVPIAIVSGGVFGALWSKRLDKGRIH